MAVYSFDLYLRRSSPEPDAPTFVQHTGPIDPLAEFYEQARAEREVERDFAGESRAMVRHGSDGKELKVRKPTAAGRDGHSRCR